MFDAICVSERTKKPWTVAISLTGQIALIGLAILVPLVSTEALPHGRFTWLSVPEPPRAMAHHAPPAIAKPVKTVPFMMKLDGLHAPSAIPDKAVIIQDPDNIAAADNIVGVPGGIESAAGPGNSIINSLVRAAPMPPQPTPAPKPAAAPAPPPRIRVGGGVQEAKLISGPRPTYPPLAKAARIEGVVHLQAVISRDGTIMDLKAVSGHPLLIPAAVAAVQHWVFRPTYLNGDPVEVATEIDVNFTLQR
jgi:protein TonB